MRETFFKKFPAKILFNLFNTNQILRVGERGDPIAEGVPLSELMRFTRVVDVNEIFVIEGDRTHLVKGRGKQLDHVVPRGTVFLAFHKLETLGLKIVDQGVERGETAFVESVV